MSYTEADTRPEFVEDATRAGQARGAGTGALIPADAPTSVKLADVVTRHATMFDANDLAVLNASVVDLQAYEGTLYNPETTNPPVNVDVPMVTQDLDVLSCTMGNWTGEPASYTYQWQLNGVPVGFDTDVATYTALAEDVGSNAACIVTAYNDQGSTKAPVSNSVVIAGP